MLESTASGDPFHLSRFEIAQASVIEAVRAELRAGRKVGHWMWFVFPQMRGLGHSEMATYYGIASQEEAEAYILHPVLGPRLRECTRLVNGIENRSIDEIFGSPDNLKFHSCMRLFAAAATDNAEFTQALRKYFSADNSLH